MLQHEFWAKKPSKKRKGRSVLINRAREDKSERRPFSTGDITDKKVWRTEDGIFSRARAVTCNGSLSSFCDYTCTATCYNCLYDGAKGRQFCEIMGTKYCHQCIKASRRKDLDQEVSCTVDITENRMTSFSDTAIISRQSPSSSLAFPNDRNWFARLRNFNSFSEYYINPMDGIRTNLVSSPQKLAHDSTSHATLDQEGCERKIQIVNHNAATAQNQFLQLPETNQDTSQRLEGTLPNRRKRKTGTAKLKRKFITFNGLPIEPPLITIDLSNQIMNHMDISEF